MTYAYDEATLDLLRLTIPIYGILVPIIKQSGTNEVIDGRHRLKIREELEAQGTRIMLPVHHVDTNSPEEIDQIVNSVRRPWQDAEQRRKLVRKLHDRGHSQRKIADTMGAAQSTINKDLKANVPADQNRSVSTAKPKATTGKDGKTKLPPATPEEIARAWAMLDAGKGKKEIAAELTRGYSTVREWFNKERPEAVQQGQPTPTPSAPPEPTQTPSVPSAGNTISKNDEPITPTGKLNKSMKDIVRRERASGKVRMKAIAELGQLKEQIEKTRTIAQRERTKLGASIHAMNVEIAEKQLVKDGETSICKSLTKIAEEAEAVRKAARQALYHLHFVDMP